jgi:phosphoglycolate phosphatase
LHSDRNLSASFQAVLFDLDGTLLETVPDLAEAANRMLASMGRPALPVELIATFVGRGIGRLVERVLTGSREGRPEAAVVKPAQALFEGFYAEESGRRSTPYPGVNAALARLHEAGVPMAVVTNKAAAFTRPLLAATGLLPYFSSVVSGDTLQWKKPDPRPVLHACEALCIAPAHALFVGDSVHDVEAARGAGCEVWCVPYGYNEGQPIAESGCDRMVSGLEEVVDRVLGLQPDSSKG